MSFKDHFSRVPEDYARYRPTYPRELFEYLASLTPGHELAWDVGTGSGQAAIELVRYFVRVVASDASAAQIESGAHHARITYKVMAAEQSDLADASVDLISVAQALHWFDFPRFYREARRVMRPGAAIAVWAYGLNQVSPAVDAVLQHHYTAVVGSYWPPERRYIDERYLTIPFPFAEVAAPVFRMQARWNLHELLGYLNTWSAGLRYHEARGHNPLELTAERMREAWGAPDEVRTVSWPIYLRVGKLAGR